MNPEVIIISPELKRGAGGVADYTLRVADEWRERVALRFLLPEGNEFDEGRNVQSIARRGAALRAQLPARGGRVLLQYSAYGFDSWGYPRWLLHELTEWRRGGGGRLVIMLHEIWTFWPLLNKNYLVQQLHRRDLGRLLRAADAGFTSTPSQAEHLRKLVPGSAVEVLPVGSNITVSGGEAARGPGLALLFGLQASRLRTLREMHGDLKSLAAARRITRLITCGAGTDGEEARLLAELALANGFEQRGALPETEISRLLAEASFGISAQDELSVTKSGSFMACAAHGLNILSPHANAAGPAPLCWLTSPAELLRGLEASELARRAEQLRTWQQAMAAWPQIAAQFARALELENAT